MCFTFFAAAELRLQLDSSILQLVQINFNVPQLLYDVVFGDEVWLRLQRSHMHMDIKH